MNTDQIEASLRHLVGSDERLKKLYATDAVFHCLAQSAAYDGLSREEFLVHTVVAMAKMAESYKSRLLELLQRVPLQISALLPERG